MNPKTPDQLERGLSERSRYSMSNAREEGVAAEAGEGRTISALRRRKLIDAGAEPVWTYYLQWRIRLTPIGIEVAALAKASDRPGGGKCA